MGCEGGDVEDETRGMEGGELDAGNGRRRTRSKGWDARGETQRKRVEHNMQRHTTYPSIWAREKKRGSCPSCLYMGEKG